MLKCAISGNEPPQNPVISRVTGHVFEKHLIETYLETNDKCPASGEPLSKEDLIEIKAHKVVPPRPVKATSIPAMLNLFQNEWDALMVETYTLREQLQSTRQELAHTLYQQDAACRVIARLTKERDEARRQLATAQAQLVAAKDAGSDSMETESTGISDQIKNKILALSKQLTAQRKKQVIPPETATESDLKAFDVAGSFAVHSASKPGILCVDIHPDQNQILTGGVDKNVVLFNREQSQISDTLQGHSKKVSDVLFHPNEALLFSASHDKTIRLWGRQDEKYTTVHTIKSHTKEVVEIALHPTGEYLLSGSMDSSWCFTDIKAGRVLAQTRPNEPEGITCSKFHPDGVILGTGTVGHRIRVWDLKTLGNVASFEGHKGVVTGISFSENGYYMASAAEDATVKLWDLRKLKVFQTVNLDGPHASSLSFDNSGKYLAVASDEIRIFGLDSKTLEPIKTLTHHTGPVTDVKFGAFARVLVSTSMDRTLKFFQ